MTNIYRDRREDEKAAFQHVHICKMSVHNCIFIHLYIFNIHFCAYYNDFIIFFWSKYALFSLAFAPPYDV